jgi:hypothetical protein
VVDLVHLQQDWLDDIVPDQLKVGLVQQVHDVVLGAGEKVVQADDLQAWCGGGAAAASGQAQTTGCMLVLLTPDSHGRPC